LKRAVAGNKGQTMEIRTYAEEDRDEVIALWNDCGLVVPWNDPAKDIGRKLQVDRDLFLVGLVEGRIVASVMGGYEGHRGWINYLAVAPELRRKGYGRQIMEEVERRIAAKGAPKINLQVRTSNTAVIAFYEALGYNIDDVVGMGKRLVSDD
jgi:ribosomal protein S18 acetylase RimI-like enzyme